MTEESKKRCPLSGIPCSECGYPGEYCPIAEVVQALETIASVLEG